MRIIEFPVGATSRQSQGLAGGSLWCLKLVPNCIVPLQIKRRPHTGVWNLFALSLEAAAAAGPAHSHYSDWPRACFNFSNSILLQPHKKLFLAAA
jgi:hypothetical protein